METKPIVVSSFSIRQISLIEHLHTIFKTVAKQERERERGGGTHRERYKIGEGGFPFAVHTVFFWINFIISHTIKMASRHLV